MSDTNKGKAKYSLAWLCLLPLIILTYCSNAFSSSGHFFQHALTADTIPTRTDTILPPNKDTLARIKDTIPKTLADSILPKDPLAPVLANENLTRKTDSTFINVIDTIGFPTSKDSLDAPVSYHADDSMVFQVPEKKLMLYGKESSVKYNTSELSAPQIEYDQKANLVTAFLKKDSLGKVIAMPAYNAGDFRSISDTIRFDMKTGRGITKGTYTQQGEMFVYGEKIKREGEDVFYASRARFTTCNLDTPHFAFVSNQIKFINKKMAFSGPVHPEFEGVPLPIYFPFGIYPLSQGRHSGLIAPSFTANEQLGFALQDIGYYKIINQNLDIITKGTLYSYGGWAFNVNPRYFKNYHYQGVFNLQFQKFKPLDQASSTTYRVDWTHRADTKARPGVTFGANVNLASTKYNEQVANDPRRNFQNSLTSNISYAKVWKDKPYNISINGNHNQNSVTRQTILNLPDIAFNVNTLYPFRRKEAIGDYKWYENLGIALNTNTKSQTSFYDTAGQVGKQVLDNLQWGASHSVPISLSLPALGPFQVSPSVSYSEKWYQQKLVRRWDPVREKTDSSIQKGFFAARDMSFGLNVTTRIFGMFTFNKKSRIQAIRHEIRPSIGVSYKPDFNRGTFYNTVIDTFGNVGRYSIYEGSIYGGFGEGKFAGMNFSLDNILTLKTRSNRDTGEATLKKVNLIDGLRLDGSYNLLADSFKLSVLALSARSNLFEKINITASAVFDPYQYNDQGRRVDKLVLGKRPSLGELTAGQVSVQSSFTGGDKKSSKETNANSNQLLQTLDPNGVPLDDYQQEAAYIRNNPGEFVDFSIPWSIDFSYSLRFNRVRQFPTNTVIKDFNQDVTFNGSVNLTAKWKIGLNGFYNISKSEITSLSMFLSREMHCWQMAINISPVGRYRFFSINISPKSAILRDLKINRTRSFLDL